MAKMSGNARKVTESRMTRDLNSLSNSSDWFIRTGMRRYSEDPNKQSYDYSDMRDLSEEEKTFLVAYLSNAYRIVNATLRGETSNSEADTLAKYVSRSLTKLQSYTGTVYRGENFDNAGDTRRESKAKYENRLSQLKSSVGKDIVFQSFISASASKDRAVKKFASGDKAIVFEIESKYGKDLRRYNDSEKEVLFDKNSKFRVLSVRGNKVKLKQL